MNEGGTNATIAVMLKLSRELKRRVASVVKGTGKSSQAFMIEAIEQHTVLAEKRKEFVAAAIAARRRFDRTREGYALEDVRKYFSARIAGKKARPPRLKRWPK